MSLDYRDLRSAWEELGIGSATIAAACLSDDETMMRVADVVASRPCVDMCLATLAKTLERDEWHGFDFDMRNELQTALSEKRAYALQPISRALTKYSCDLVKVAKGALLSEEGLDVGEAVARACVAPDLRPATASAAAELRGALAACSLTKWFESKDREIMRFAVDWPACWGGQYRVSDLGHYVPEERFLEVLPTPAERSLYLCLCEPDGFEGVVDVARHAKDVHWLDERADDYVGNSDAVVFYTETAEPDEEYSFDELVELARERPDLFTDSCIDEYPALAEPARVARSRAAETASPAYAADAASSAAMRTASRPFGQDAPARSFRNR